MGEEIELDINRSVHENAAAHYERAKELRKKAQSAEKAIAETRKLLSKEAGKEKVEVERKTVRVKREKKWYERFHWFESDGFMVLAGRDAKQNEELVGKQLTDDDLFFHADIHGAPATILKNGKKAPEKVLKETAQFAGAYSSAWKAGVGSVDVYAVESSQVSKEAQGEHVGKGAFMISGKRNWFKNTAIELMMGVGEDGVPVCIPAACGRKFSKSVRIRQGNKEKGEAARAIAKELGVSVDEVLSLLPAGNFGFERSGG